VDPHIRQFRAYRVNMAQELRPPDAEKRLQYFEWFIRNDVSILDKTFCTDEAWFHLNGYIKSQNTRIWATENPHTLHEVPHRVGQLWDPAF
jgi:hypothetical protein